MATATLWELVVIASAVVVLVPAALLGLVVAAARSVDRHSAAIRDTGEQIADNTAAIRMLVQANDALRGIRAALERLEGAAHSLDRTVAARRREES